MEENRNENEERDERTVDPAVMEATAGVKLALAHLKAALADAVKAERIAAAAAGREVRATIDWLVVEEIMTLNAEAMELFAEFSETLTPTERTRLVGAGIKNFGFIETAWNSAHVNPQLVPGYLDMVEFGGLIRDFQRKQRIHEQVAQFDRTVADSMLATANRAFKAASEYYNYLKEAARRNVPGAETEYRLLSVYFKSRGKHRQDSEPTAGQIERDVRGLLHGTKEGKVVIANENPQATGGRRSVVDETSSRQVYRQTDDRSDRQS
ncbi:MAG: hypothetical protein LBK22_10550 [Tannerella sp.]|jgi:hypothetical protein|nr:hypothetical protein [Tannerella sp.]